MKKKTEGKVPCEGETNSNANPTKTCVFPLQKALLSSSVDEIILLLNNEPTTNNESRVDETAADNLQYFKNLIERLLNQKISLNLPETNYSTLLHFVIRHGDKETFQSVLSKDLNFDINALNLEKESLLHVAVNLGQTEIVEILLNFGLEIDVRDPQKRTPLHYAASAGNCEIIKLLLSHGADVNAATSSNTRPLNLVWESVKLKKPFHAMNISDTIIFRLLLEHGAEIRPSNKHDKLLIRESIQGNFWDLVLLLLNHGAKIDLKTREATEKLYTVMCEEDFDVLKILLMNSLDMNSMHGGKGTPIHFLINIHHSFSLHNKTRMIEFLVKSGVDINTSSNFGKPVLHIAAEKSLLQIAKCLIKLGADVNAQDKSGLTPLLIAWKCCFRSHSSYYEDDHRLEMVKLLLSNGADVNYGAKWGNENNSPLQQALLSTSLEKIQFILKKGYNLQISNEADDFKKCSRVVEFLLNQEVNLILRNTKYSTLLHFVGLHGNEATLKLVLEKCKNFDINASDNSGQTLLHHVIEMGKESIIQDLIQYGADIDLQDAKGRTPLHYAVRRNDPTIAGYLLNHGVKINVADCQGHTPLHYSVCFENKEIIEMLLSQGADVNAKSAAGTMPLHLVCGRSVLKKLLLENPHGNKSEEEGYSAVMFCGHKPEAIFNKEIMQLLIARGADINAVGFRGMTLLTEASLGGDLDIVTLLLKNGADIEAKDEEQRTPLMQACLGGHLKVVLLLLSKGAVIDKVDLYLNNLLHLAALGNQVNVAEFLLRKGFKVNSTNGYNYTPLTNIFGSSNAARNIDRSRMLDLLVDYEADVNIKTKRGHTLVDLSVEWDDPALVEYFLELNVEFTGMDNCYFGMSMPKCLEIVIAFLVRRNVENIKLHHWNVDEYCLKCQLELVRGKEMRVCETSRISFYDFLTYDLTELAPIFENDKIMEVFESGEYKNEFPCYGFILERRISRIKQLSVFMRRTEDFLKKHAKKKLPDLVLDKIFSFLRFQDFRSLMRVLSLLDTRS